MGGARQLLLTTAVLITCHQGLWGQDRIQWVNSWADAQLLAARHQRLVLIHFWSPDCVPCQKLERSVFNQPEFTRAIATGYVAWKVNVAENPTVARDLRVDRWPTDVIMTAAGQEVYRGPSPAEPNRYIALLDQIAAHTRLGMPSGVPASSNAAPAGPGLATAPSSSAFPLDPAAASTAYQPANAYQTPAGYQPSAANPSPTGYQPESGYPLPTGQGPFAAQTPASPTASSAFPLPSNSGPPSNTIYGPPAAAAAPPSAATPPAPAYVNNQWIVPDSSPTRSPIAEQRASYTAPAGGEFQPSASAAPTMPPVAATSQLPSGPPGPSLGAPVSATGMLGTPTAESIVPPQSADAPSLGGPASGPPAGPPAAAQPATDTPPIGLDGYCPVTLVEQEKWVKGDRKWGAHHRGRLYFFLSPEAQQRFMDNFDKYAPALSGYDAVRYSEQGKLVEGKRAHGVFYRGQIFLFADEAALEQFWTAPERYAATVRAEQQASTTRSGVQR